MMETAEHAQLVHYLPIATTAIAAAFCAVLLRRYLLKRTGAHLLWWAGGIFCYGLGTALEGAITLHGNTIVLNKAWYIAGALLGGYPLAQGSVYLLLKRRTAHVLSALTVPFIVLASILVILSPVHEEPMQPHKPGGAILAWSWVRLLTPIINTYAVVFLIGGAILSAVRFARRSHVEFAACPSCGSSLLQLPIDEGRITCPECGNLVQAELIGLERDPRFPLTPARQAALRERHEARSANAGSRAIGNGLIAFGAMLPGVGGGLAKAGMVEGLYVGEFVGLLLIWAGYRCCVRGPRPQPPATIAEQPAAAG